MTKNRVKTSIKPALPFLMLLATLASSCQRLAPTKEKADALHEESNPTDSAYRLRENRAQSEPEEALADEDRSLESLPSTPPPEKSEGANREIVGKVRFGGRGKTIALAQELMIARPSSGLNGQAIPPGDRYRTDFNTESYDRIEENDFLASLDHPLSTFSIDVDTASYSNVRRFVNQGSKPPKDAVRIEELINYFTYDYAPPANGDPFAVHIELAEAPWNPRHRLAKIGLKGREIDPGKRPDLNLVFLLDVSGSMNAPNKLPLLKRSVRLLIDQLDRYDRVSVVVYAGASGLALAPTPGDDRNAILGALDRLRAGGSTNGASGIELAYEIATENFIRGGANRVILATDGDFNIGVTNRGDLHRLIEEKAKSGVFLSVLGFGMGNYKDATLEMLADKGNGNYAYIDTIAEAKKALVDQMTGTLVTIAKDVKIQVEFNPNRVSAYRLIGYENRRLAARDFNDDQKDAGEIGAGHTVTALYEIVPAGVRAPGPSIDPLKYQTPTQPSREAGSGELMTVKLRYKEPQATVSRLLSFPVADAAEGLDQSSDDFRWAAAVAAWGMMLRDSKHQGDASADRVIRLAQAGLGDDRYGYRAEFLDLVRRSNPTTRRSWD